MGPVDPVHLGRLVSCIAMKCEHPEEDCHQISVVVAFSFGWWFQICFSYVHHYLGKVPMLTSIFFSNGWFNHQPVFVCPSEMGKRQFGGGNFR